MQLSRIAIAAALFAVCALLILPAVGDPKTLRALWAALVLAVCVGVPYLIAQVAAWIVDYLRERHQA